MSHPAIAAIVAMSENRVIGKNNQLPWHLPADLQHFKRLTIGHPILMGRKTYESIGKALPNRTNIVITRETAFTAPGCLVVNSLEQAIKSAKTVNDNEIFIIGGATIFEQSLDFIDRLYLTVIHAEIEGDSFFPPLDLTLWREVSREDFKADSKNPYDYSFVGLER